MSVRSDLRFEAAGQELLNHREAKDVVRQALVRVIRAHDRNHFQLFLAQEELQCRGAWNLNMGRGKVFRIEYLNHGAACSRSIVSIDNTLAT